MDYIKNNCYLVDNCKLNSNCKYVEDTCIRFFKIDFLLTKVYTDISNDGVNKVINKKNLEKLYKKYVG